jgi:hypothetical protein
MAIPHKRLKCEARGQAMVETALIVPLLLGLVLNAVNFGYFFLVALNLTASPRSGVEYSILGASTPIGVDLADPGPTTAPSSVSFLTLGELTGAVG